MEYPAAPDAGVAVVVEIVTGVEAPGMAGVMLKLNGVADNPAATGTDTVQSTDVAVPDVSVATTFGVVLEPAVILAAAGVQTTE
jgi:hypothetical protein